jgi:hypothetical protein
MTAANPARWRMSGGKGGVGMRVGRRVALTVCGRKQEDLRFALSTLVFTTFDLRSYTTSRTPKRCQSRRSRTTSCRVRPRPTWKQTVLLAGLMCRKRESQFVCSSAERVDVPSFEDGGRSKAERSDVLLRSAGAPREAVSRLPATMEIEEKIRCHRLKRLKRLKRRVRKGKLTT